MVYKNFYIQVIVRILLIVVNSFWLVTAITTPQKIYTTIVASSLFVFQVVALLTYVNRINREVTRFFASLKDEYSSLQLPEKSRDSFGQLNTILNKTGDMIRNARIEKEKQYQFLNFILENIAIGILVCNENGKIVMINKSLKDLLKIADIQDLKQVPKNKVDINLLSKIMKPGDQRILKTKVDDSFMQLLVKSHRFRIEDDYIQLFTFQDVKNELEGNELESWQKLIRVLNHEIMNSMTPINTLTLAIRKCLTEGNAPRSVDELSSELIEDAIKNSHLIEERSNGLIKFVENYRSLTRIDSLNIRKCSVLAMVEDIRILFQKEIADQNIQLNYVVDPKNLEIEVDRNLIEQVLMNIVKNAIQAVDDEDNPLISIEAEYNSKSQCVISIQDNGLGIDPEQMEDIFIPFYTTKKDGTGIGLSLARQIMRLHGGNISVQSVMNESTVFKLIF